MSDITLKNEQTFPVGATVAAYPQSNWPFHSLPPSGAPLGSADDSVTVASDGTIDFTGLSEATAYFAYSHVGSEHRYVNFLIEAVGPAVDLGEHEAATTNVHGIDNTANVPSTAQKAALAGTQGTPGSTNKYVTGGTSPPAYTQTYLTAARTVPNATASAVATTAAGLASYGYTEAQANAIVTALNAEIADLLALKKVVNGVIDDLQTAGVLS